MPLHSPPTRAWPQGRFPGCDVSPDQARNLQAPSPPVKPSPSDYLISTCHAMQAIAIAHCGRSAAPQSRPPAGVQSAMRAASATPQATPSPDRFLQCNVAAERLGRLAAAAAAKAVKRTHRSRRTLQQLARWSERQRLRSCGSREPDTGVGCAARLSLQLPRRRDQRVASMRHSGAVSLSFSAATPSCRWLYTCWMPCRFLMRVPGNGVVNVLTVTADGKSTYTYIHTSTRSGPRDLYPLINLPPVATCESVLPRLFKHL
jgi:hypothetical protein